MTQNWVTIYDLFEDLSKSYRNVKALVDSRHEMELTYFQLFEKIKLFATSLQTLGISPDDKISLFSENQARWLVADQGILAVGAADAVRGSFAPVEELNYILRNSESKALIIENLECFEKLYPLIEDVDLKFVIYFQKGKKAVQECKFPIYSFEEFLEVGKDNNFVAVDMEPDSLATLIYTSGTTGNPKGVMLTHANLVSQVKNLKKPVKINPNSKVLNILPIWHAYERTLEYFLASRGVTFYYTNLRNLKNDLNDIKPNYFISVPRLWESFYDGVHKEIRKSPALKRTLATFLINSSLKLTTTNKLLNNTTDYYANISFFKRILLSIQKLFLTPLHSLGDVLVYKNIRQKLMPELKFSVLGGGALARHTDDFFNTIGINLVEGYGLTETAPVLTVRTEEVNVLFSVGPAIPETEIKIVDIETKEALPNYKKGIVVARGPQIMKGYYNNPEATKEVMLEDGWFNTGDLGWLTENGSLVLQGRAKDTIVLSNGENIEPQGIEDVCLESPYINQIVIVGQDKPSLGAIVIPDMENCKEIAGASCSDEDICSHPEVQKVIMQEVRNRVASRPNHRSWEQVSNVKMIKDAFSIENGLLTQSLKIKKNKVFEKYNHLIEEMYTK